MITPYYQDAYATIYHGDCREILPQLEPVDLVLTDPPYQTHETGVPIRGRGVGQRVVETVAVGKPWGYSTDWIDLCRLLEPKHWIAFCNYQMLGDICAALPPQTVFVWRKANAPQMTRPVPRLDCEFIVWHRSGGDCGDMGKFKSMVIDVAMPQAGCFATERILESSSNKAAHPCQKPIAIVSPFLARLNVKTLVDPFMGSGTTLRAAKDLGLKSIGIEIEEKYCEIAVKRLRQEILFGETA
jgi:site-specific DNA-methyltransferase (adenine-specific)